MASPFRTNLLSKTEVLSLDWSRANPLPPPILPTPPPGQRSRPDSLDALNGKGNCSCSREGFEQRVSRATMVRILRELELKATLPPNFSLACPLSWADDAGQNTGNIWAPKYYIFPINDLPHIAPLLFIFLKEKSRKKIRAKAIQGRVSWVNLKKNFQISFSQYTNNVGTPLFRSMRQAQNTDTHALNQLRVSPK